MLSSPIAPSSPPLADYVTLHEYSQVLHPQLGPRPGLLNASLLSHATHGSACTSTRECEYKEATTMTKDETEIVTPEGSQDAQMAWVDD